MKITTIVFNKTGTLTVGKFEVSKVVSLQKELNENEIVRLASALEQQSEHPIATGILQKVKELPITIPATENFKTITGKAVEATVEGKKILVVSPAFVMVQPIIRSNRITMGKNCISKCCGKQQDKKQQSENNDCNPFLACSLPTLLLSPKVTVSLPPKYLFKQQYFIFNDNRIIKHLSSLFHPSNMV